jgi:hypothetical protein
MVRTKTMVSDREPRKRSLCQERFHGLKLDDHAVNEAPRTGAQCAAL